MNRLGLKVIRKQNFHQEIFPNLKPIMRLHAKRFLEVAPTTFKQSIGFNILIRPFTIRRKFFCRWIYAHSSCYCTFGVAEKENRRESLTANKKRRILNV